MSKNNENNINKYFNLNCAYLKVDKDIIEYFIPVFKEFGEWKCFNKITNSEKISYYFTFKKFIDSISLIYCLNSFKYKDIYFYCAVGINKKCISFNRYKKCKKNSNCYYIHGEKNIVKIIKKEDLKYENVGKIINRYVENNFEKILEKLNRVKNKDNQVFINFGIKKLIKNFPDLYYKNDEILSTTSSDKDSIIFFTEELESTELDNLLKKKININKKLNKNDYLKLLKVDFKNNLDFFNTNIKILISNKVGIEFLIKEKENKKENRNKLF